MQSGWLVQGVPEEGCNFNLIELIYSKLVRTCLLQTNLLYVGLSLIFITPTPCHFQLVHSIEGHHSRPSNSRPSPPTHWSSLALLSKLASTRLTRDILYSCGGVRWKTQYDLDTSYQDINLHQLRGTTHDTGAVQCSFRVEVTSFIMFSFSRQIESSLTTNSTHIKVHQPTDLILLSGAKQSNCKQKLLQNIRLHESFI